MTREELIAMGAFINLAGIHEENESQRKARVRGAIDMATAVAEALGMKGGSGDRGHPADGAAATPSTPPPGQTFGIDSATAIPTAGQMQPERTATSTPPASPAAPEVHARHQELAPPPPTPLHHATGQKVEEPARKHR